jgi:signal transduction histidine kinase
MSNESQQTERERLVAFLRRCREAVLEEWRIPERLPEEVAALPLHDRVDAMPNLYDELCERLLEDALSPERFSCARTHATHRQDTGVSIPAVVLEFTRLREIVLEHLDRGFPTCGRDQRAALHAAIDSALVASTNAHLQAALDFRGAVLGIVSHDLRSPLNTIVLGTAALLRRADLPPAASGVIARIAAAGRRASRLVNNVLDYARTRYGGTLRLARDDVDLVEVARSIVEEVRLGAPNRPIRIEAPGPQMRGSWDPDQLGQALANLLGNAVQHGERGVITVRLLDLVDHCEVSVHNYGPAIPPEERERLFQPYWSGEGEPSPGAGLGLHITRLIARAHGGDVEVESSDMHGTTFTLSLPRRS